MPNGKTILSLEDKLHSIYGKIAYYRAWTSYKLVLLSYRRNMNSDEASVDWRKGVSWGKSVLIMGGLVWITRAGIEFVLQPDYWNPQTVADYAPVAGTSFSISFWPWGSGQFT